MPRTGETSEQRYVRNAEISWVKENCCSGIVQKYFNGGFMKCGIKCEVSILAYVNSARQWTDLFFHMDHKCEQ